MTKIDSLTSLRFFAAWGVFLSHLSFIANLNIPLFNKIYKIFFECRIGVSFFFILSGFIIAYSYSQQLLEKRVSLTDFLFYRIFRLYPVHLLTLAMAVPMVVGWAVLEKNNLLTFFLNFGLLQSYIPDAAKNFSYNGVSWSISVEMFFYVMFCYMVKFSTRQLMALFCGILVLISFHLILIPNSAPHAFWLFYVNPAFRVIDFLSGILLCRLYFYFPYKPKLTLASLGEITSIAVVTLFIYIALKYDIRANLREDIYYLFPLSLVILIFAYNKGIISKFLSHRIFVFLGEASFSFYMTHVLVLVSIFHYFKPQLTTAKQTIFLCVGIWLATIVVSSLLYVCFERPLNIFLRRKWRAYKEKKRAATYSEALPDYVPV